MRVAHTSALVDYEVSALWREIFSCIPQNQTKKAPEFVFTINCVCRHGSTQQLGEEQWDNTTQLLLVPLLGTHQSTPTNVHSRLGAQHLKPTVV